MICFVDYRTTENEINSLKKLNYDVIKIPKDNNLYEAINGHTDIQLNILNKHTLIVNKNINLSFKQLLETKNINFIESDSALYVDSYKDILNLNTDLFNISALSFDPNRIKNGIAEASKIKGVNVVSSAYNNFEFQSDETSKGKSLAFIADYLHISLDDTMAIGDNYNDVSMFEHAYHSVAMGNSNDDIKNLCRYTTLTNLESGVGHAIKTFALNK